MNYPKVTPEAKEAFWKLVSESNSIFITSHRSPDDDSISSTLGLYSSIMRAFPEKKVRVVYTNVPTPRFGSFINYDRIEFVADNADEIKGSDLIILLDAGQWHRTTKQPETFAAAMEAGVKTVCIDHHTSEPDPFTLSIIDTEASCCSMLAYKLSDHLNIDKPLAEAFLLGILGDTGNFAYVKPHQTEVFLIAKQLVEIGQIKIDEFQSGYRSISENIFKIMQEFMKNMNEGKVDGYKAFSWSYISREYINAHKLEDPDVVEAKNIFTAMFLRSIENHPWGFVIVPKPDNTTNVSFRSLPTGENVRELAESLGQGGGGHDAAAGCNLADISDPLEAYGFVTEQMRKNKTS